MLFLMHKRTLKIVNALLLSDFLKKCAIIALQHFNKFKLIRSQLSFNINKIKNLTRFALYFLIINNLDFNVTQILITFLMFLFFFKHLLN